jgi:hypothetical protein
MLYNPYEPLPRLKHPVLAVGIVAAHEGVWKSRKNWAKTFKMAYALLVLRAKKMAISWR